MRQTAAPAGWFTNPQLRTGDGDGSNSQANTYQFQTPPLQSGETYSSTDDFMESNGNFRTASGGVWQQSRTNPPLARSCGLDLAILLDVSGSVAPAIDQLKGATDTIVDALVGTPSRVALFSFASDTPAEGATPNAPALVPVSSQGGADAVKAVYAPWTAGGGTNWDRGIQAVADAGPDYELLLVITDGNPTYFGSPPDGNGADTRFRETEQGTFSANAVKAEGTRIAAVGVGSGVAGDTGLNLRALSGPDLYPAEPPDYFQTADYDQAAAIVRDLALGQCEGTLNVVKQLVPAGTTGEDVTGAVPAGPGWELAGSTTTPGIGGLPATKTTADDGTGTVSFPLQFPGGTDTAAVQVNETQQAGYELVTQNSGANAVCFNLATTQPIPVTDDDSDPAEPGFTVDVPSRSSVSCTVYNRPSPTDVKVDKEWVVDGTTYPEGSQPAGLTAALTLTGPGGAPAGPQPWGTVRTGYTQQATATIAETTQLDGGCTLDSARVTSANGGDVDEALPYDATLTREHNTYTVTNTVTCPPPPTTTTTSTSTSSTSSTTSTSVPPSTTPTTKPAPPPPPPPPPKPNLPKTGGGGTGALAAIGLGLLVSGVPLAVWARRRAMGGLG